MLIAFILGINSNIFFEISNFGIFAFSYLFFIFLFFLLFFRFYSLPSKNLDKILIEGINFFALKNLLILIFISHVIYLICATIFLGGFPLYWIIIGDERTYVDFIIPSISGLFNLTRSFGLVACLLLLMFGNRNNKKYVYLIGAYFLLSSFFIETSRGNGLVMLLHPIGMYLLLRKIYSKQLSYSFLLFFSFIFFFGLIQVLRYGDFDLEMLINNAEFVGLENPNIFPAICLIPFVVRALLMRGAHVKQAFWSGLFIGFGFAFYTFAMLETSIVRATLLFYLTPIWSTILGVLILFEPFTKSRTAAICIGLFGCFILLIPGYEQSVPLNIGDLYGVLGGVFWAAGATCVKRWPETPTLLITWFQMVSTTAVGLGIVFLIYHTPMPELAVVVESLPITFGASVFVLLPSTLILVVISQVLFPGRVGVLMMSEVLVAIVSASIFLPNETMSPLKWGGAVAIISASFFEVFFVATDKPISKTGETSLRAGIRSKSLL